MWTMNVYVKCVFIDMCFCVCCLKEHTYFICTFKCKLLLFIIIPLTNDKSQTYAPIYICTYIII